MLQWVQVDRQVRTVNCTVQAYQMRKEGDNTITIDKELIEGPSGTLLTCLLTHLVTRVSGSQSS